MIRRLSLTTRLWVMLCLVLLAPLGKVCAQNGLQVLGLQVPIGSSPSSFTQNFDALNSGITVSLAGLLGNVDGIYSNRTLIFSSTGAPNVLGNVPTSGGYNFGTTSERALGSNSNLLNSAVGLVPIRYGAMVQNNTGLPITSLTITYTGEQWYRDGDGAAQTLFFDYVPIGTVASGLVGSLLNSTFLLAGGIGEAISLGGITYTPVSVSALNFVSPNNTGGAATLDGNAAGNRTARTAVISVNIPANGYILLRWTDPDDGDALLDLLGTDHSLAVDNLVVSATTLNSPPTVTGTIPNQSVSVGSTVNIPTAGAFTEPDGQILSYSATGLPPVLSINSTSGAITGTVAVTGVFPITVTATDPLGLSVSTTFNLTVTQATATVNQGGLICLGQPLSLTLLPLNLPVGAMVVIKGPNNVSAVVSSGVISLPTGVGGLPSGSYNLTLTASATLPIVGTVELLNLPIPITIPPLPALPTGLSSQTAALGSLLSLTGVCNVGDVLTFVTSTGSSGTAIGGIIPISTVSAGVQTLTAVCVNASGCSGPSQLLNISILNLAANALNILPTAPVCLGQPLNLSLLGSGTLADLLAGGVSLTIAGPNNFSISTTNPGSVLSLTGLPAGTYSLSVTASVLGLTLPTIQVPVSIISLQPVTGLLTSQTALQNGMLTLVGSCPTGILSYSSSAGSSGTAVSGIGIPVSTLGTGVQSVTVVCLDPNGCLSVPTVANINVVAPLLNVVQGALACVGQATSLTLLPTNFNLADPLVSISITGPAGVSISALDANGIISVGGISSTATSLSVNVSVAGTQLVSLPISVSALPLPALPSIPSTLTALAGAPLSLSGLCPTGVLGTLTNLTQGIIPINTATPGVQSLSIICNNGGCISPTQLLSLSILSPILNVVQGALACVGQATSLTLLPTNFGLTDALVSVGITGPAGVTVSAINNGVVSIGGLSTTATTLAVSVSVAGVEILNLPVSVSALPLPALPSLPTTLTALAGAPLSLSGLCATGVLGTLTNLTQGIIPISTTAVGTQSLSLICNNNGCISLTQVLNLSVIAPVLNVVQGALACVGQATSLTLLPTNFGLTDPLVSISVTGPAGVSASAVGPNGIVSIGGLSSTATSLSVNVSVAGTQVLSLPISVSALPLPALPNIPATLTALAGSAFSLSGLCPTGVLGTLTNLTQGIIPISTSAVGTQSLTLICNNNGCISLSQVLNLSILGGSLIPGLISPICLGQSLDLPLTGVGALSDLTSGLVSLSVTGPVNLSTTILGPGLIRIGGLTAGAYNLTITPAVSNIPLPPITVPVNIISLSAVTGLVPTQTIIQNTSLSLLGTCPTGGILSFTNSAGTSGTATSGAGIPILTNALGAQSYTVVCTDANGCISPTTIANLSVVSPLLNVLQGPLVCLGQPTSLTLLPLNFGLTDPLVSVAITGPAGVTASAVGSNGVVTIGGLTSATTTVFASVSVAGVQVLNLPITVNSLPLPAAPNLPTTLTTLLGSTLSLTGLCPTGVLTSLGSLAQVGTILVPTSTTGTQSLSLVCNNGSCISLTNIVNLSVVAPLLNTLTNSPICLGQPLALTLVPLNFGLNDGLVSLSVTGPINSTVSAIGPNGVVSIGNLSAGSSNITVTARIAGITVTTITVPISVLSTPAPSVTTISGQPAYAGGQTAVSVTANSGNVLFQASCTAGTLSYTGSVGGAVNTGAQITFITVPTTTTGVFTYTAVCVNGACISANTVVSVSVVNPAAPVNQPPTLVGGGIPSPQSATVGIGFSLATGNSFTDPNNDPLTFAATGLPTGLSITPGTGVISGVPSVSGTFGVTVTANDGRGGTVSSVFTLNVSPAAVVNQPPVAGVIPSPQSATVGVAFSTTTAGAFTDPNGDALTFAASGLPTGLSIAQGTGLISGAPSVSGTFGIVVTASDGKGGSAQAFFILNVSPAAVVNQPPVLVGGGIPSPQSATVGLAFSTTTAGAFSDPNGDPLSYSATGLPTGLAINPSTGVISGVPSVSGITGVAVTASDGKGGSATSTFILNVFPAPVGNQPPIAGIIPSPQSATVGIAFSTTTAGAFTDPNGDPLSFTATNLPTGISINPTTGLISGVPSVSGTFGIVVTANDGRGGSAQALFVLNVSPAAVVNQPPVLVGGGIPSPQSATVGLAFSTTTAGAFSDPNGDPLSFTATGLPGGLSINPTTGLISGVPSVSGSFGVSVTASDNKGGSVTSVFTLNVSPAAGVNQPPVLVGNIPSPQSATVGLAFSTTTAGAFSDPNGDPLSFSATGLPTGITINPTTGVISGVPSVSGTFGVIVTASDGRGGSVPAALVINVVPAAVINQPPVLVGGGIPSPQSATVGVAFSTTTAGAFSDPNGDPLSFTATGLPAGLGISPVSGIISGIPSVSGTFGVTVTANDGKGGSVSSIFILNVSPAPVINLPPAVVGGGIPSPQSATVGIAFSTTTAGAFSDPNGDPLSFTATGLPAGLSIAPTTGLISGVPSVSGSFGIVVTANDGKGGSAQSAFVLNVSPVPAVNQPPVLIATLPSPQSGTVNVAFSTTTAGAFSDPNGDPLSFSATGLPTGITINPTTGVISGVPTQSGSFVVTVFAGDGQGTPASGQFTLNISPAPAVNQPPTVVGAGLPSPQSTTVGVAFSTTTAGAFTDPNGDALTFSASGLPTGLSINPTTGLISGVAAVASTYGIVVTANDNRGGVAQSFFILNVFPAPSVNVPPTLVGGGIPSPQSATVGVAFSTTTAGAFFDANADALTFSASGLPAGLGIAPTTGVISGVPSVSGTFPVTVSANDGRGGSVSSVFILNVSPASTVNLPPVIVGNGLPSPQSATVGVAFSTTTAGAFSDPNGDPLTYSASGLPAGLNITPGTGLISGTPSVSGTFGIVVTASDGKGGSAQAAFILNVAPAAIVNQPPVLVNGGIPSPQSATVNIAFSTTTAGAFSDPNGDPLTFSASGLPAGLVIIPGTGVITGVPSVSGTYGITVFASDGKGGSASSTFILTVFPAQVVNQPPVIVGNGIPSPQSATVTIAFSTTTAGAFSDPNGDPLTFSASGLPGGLSINPTTGLISGVPTVAGNFGIIVTASDGKGGSAQGAFILNVFPAPSVNQPPTVVGAGIPSPQSATVNVAFSTTTAGAFSDPNGDPLTFSATGLPAGLVIIPSTGVITGVPSVSGTYPISVVANDGKGGTASSIFVLNVVPAATVNQPPVLVNGGIPSPQSATVNVTFSTTTAGAFSDPNGDVLTYSASGLPSGLSINPTTGLISGVPSVSGTFGIIVTASDGRGGSAQGAFILNVFPAPTVNMPPVLVNGGIPSPQSATVTIAFSTTTAGAFSDPNGDVLTYSASGLPGGLSINPTTGLISGVPSVSGTFPITVSANDGRGGSVSSVFILNVFPAPTVNLPPVLVGGGIPSPQSATVTIAFSTTTAGAFSDPNGDPLTYSANGLPGGLTISPTTGLISGTPSVSGTFGIIVTASDGRGGSASSPFVLNVSPAPAVNQPPVLVGGGIPSPQSATVGMAFSTTTAGAFTDPNGDPLNFSASGLPSGLTINPVTGVISGAPSVSGTYPITVLVNDGKGGNASSIFILNVSPAPVASGPLGVTVVSYNCTTGAIVFGRVGGDPSRAVEYLAVNSTGWSTSPFATIGSDIRNDPSMSTIVVFIRYVGDASNIASFSFNFRTFCGSQGNGAPVYNGTLANQIGTVGTPFTYTFPANAFTDPEGQALTYTAIGLPPGLTLSGRTISGTPQLQGSFAVTILAQDPLGASQTGSFNITINPAPVVGTPLAVTVSSYTCATGAIVFSRLGGDPNRVVEYFAIGVRLNNATPYSINPNGTIEAELRNDVNQSTITVIARYVGDPSSAVSFVYNFRTPCAGQTPNQPPVYNGGLQNLIGTVGVPFSYTLPTTLFSDPENQAITLGAAGLPPGVALIGRVISGTPTVAGIYEPVYIFAFDPQRASAQGIFRFTVNTPTAGNQPPVVTGTIPNQTATVGIFYTYTIPNNVFTDPEGQALTFSLAGEPRRLEVNGRVISGFPLINGTYPITVTARDPQGAATSTTYILTVLPNPGCGSDPSTLGQPLELLQPTYSCATGVIKFNTRGGNGTTITYAAIGITVPTTDCFDQMDTEVAEDVRNDKPNVQPFIIRAIQGGTVIQYAFDARAFCRGGGREATGLTQTLDVTVLGNPTNSDAVEVEVRGAEGESLRLRVADPTGSALSEQHVERAGAVERVRVPLNRSTGVYLLQVNSPSKTKVVKIVRQ